MNALRQAQIQREWLGYEEARRLVGLSRTTLCRLVRTGEIKGARIGRSVRIHHASLEEYIERRVVSGNENSHHAQVRLRHHPGAGPRRARARAWVFVFDCYPKKAARTRSGEDGMSGPENDRATSKGGGSVRSRRSIRRPYEVQEQSVKGKPRRRSLFVRRGQLER